MLFRRWDIDWSDGASRRDYFSWSVGHFNFLQKKKRTFDTDICILPRGKRVSGPESRAEQTHTDEAILPGRDLLLYMRNRRRLPALDTRDAHTFSSDMISPCLRCTRLDIALSLSSLVPNIVYVYIEKKRLCDTGAVYNSQRGFVRFWLCFHFSKIYNTLLHSLSGFWGK